MAKRLAELGALHEHTSVENAADLLWLYTAPEIYRMLVIERKWSPNRYREWFRAPQGERPQHLGPVLGYSFFVCLRSP